MKQRFDRLETLRIILKRSRQKAILTILNQRRITTQEQLRDALLEQGIRVTQATLSRDLRKIKAVKVPIPEGYRYILPDHPHYQRKTSPSTISDYLRASGFESIDFSGNLAVVHTRPGYAGGLASDIDARSLPTIIGTIAGDDTVLIIMAEDTNRQSLIDDLATVIPAIKSVML